MRTKIGVCAVLIGLLCLGSFGSAFAEIDYTTGLDSSKSNIQQLQPKETRTSAGGNVLWDIHHGVFLDYKPTSRYISLSSLLMTNGFSIDENDAGILTVNLNNYDIIVICLGSSWYTAYSPEEVSAIISFVAGGGGLLLLSDNPDCPNANIASISEAFGTTVGIADVIQSSFTDLTTHPVLSGVTELHLVAAGEIAGTTPSSEQAWGDKGEAVITVAQYGSGRVVIVGDINAMEDQYIADAQNQLFSENVFNWLGAGGWGGAYQILFGDSSDLELFRQYRDNVLSKTMKGEVYKSLLYLNSEEALQVLLTHPHLMDQLKYLIDSSTASVRSALEGEEAVISDSERFILFLDDFAKQSPPVLKILAYLIKRDMLKHRLHGETFFGFKLY